jgi:sugar phosphate isomerase/epimerase
MVLGSPQQRNLLPGVTKPEAMRYAAECIQGALKTLAENNVVLCVEPLGPAEGDFLLTAAEGVELCEIVGSPHCRLHLDVKAMSSESTPIPSLIRKHHSLLHHFHANDPNRQGPGFGDVDFLPIFTVLGEVDYQGWVSVEVFDYTPGVERLARQSIEYMRTCLGQLAGR